MKFSVLVCLVKTLLILNYKQANMDKMMPISCEILSKLKIIFTRLVFKHLFIINNIFNNTFQIKGTYH